MSEKKARILEMAEKMLSEMPMPQRMMVQAFFPQFLACVEQADDTFVDSMIDKGKALLHYIETGESYGDPEHH